MIVSTVMHVDADRLGLKRFSLLSCFAVKFFLVRS